MILKEKYAKEWAINNGYKYVIISQEWFINNLRSILNSDLPDEIKEQLKNTRWQK